MENIRFFLGLGVVVVGLGFVQAVSTIEVLQERVDRLQREVGICCGTEALPEPSSVMSKDLEFVVKLRKEVEELERRVERLEKEFAVSP